MALGSLYSRDVTYTSQLTSLITNMREALIDRIEGKEDGIEESVKTNILGKVSFSKCIV